MAPALVECGGGIRLVVLEGSVFNMHDPKTGGLILTVFGQAESCSVKGLGRSAILENNESGFIKSRGIGFPGGPVIIGLNNEQARRLVDIGGDSPGFIVVGLLSPPEPTINEAG